MMYINVEFFVNVELFFKMINKWVKLFNVFFLKMSYFENKEDIN